MRETRAQLVEDGKAVCVDVAPVMDMTVHQPPCTCQRFPAITAAENGDGAIHRWKCQEIGFIFGNENMLQRDLQLRKAAIIQ